MYQEHQFGEIYWDAHLARINQEPEIIDQLHKWSKEPRGILYFCGNVGTGKTYFCAAFVNYLKEIKKTPRVYSEQKFFSELKNVMHMNWDPGIHIDKIAEVEYFILDDMGSSLMTDWQKEMLFHLVDLRSSNGKPTLITSNLNKQDIKSKFHDRFASRLFASNNIYIELTGNDRREMI